MTAGCSIASYNDDNTTWHQLRDWCSQARRFYLMQCWLRWMTPHGVSRLQQFEGTDICQQHWYQNGPTFQILHFSKIMSNINCSFHSRFGLCLYFKFIFFHPHPCWFYKLRVCSSHVIMTHFELPINSMPANMKRQLKCLVACSSKPLSTSLMSCN